MNITVLFPISIQINPMVFVFSSGYSFSSFFKEVDFKNDFDKNGDKIKS